MPQRRGTEKDREMLMSLFGKKDELGFEVIVRDNLKTQQMLDLMILGWSVSFI